MPIEELNRLVLYVSAAISYAVAGYMAKVRKHPEVSFSPVRFATTVLIGLVAGVIMALRGDDATEEAYIAAAVISIPIADKLLNLALDAAGSDRDVEVGR